MTPASPHHNQGGRQGSHNFTRSIMAKKSKRRGRPPGAKSPDKMDVGQLRQYIERLQSTLSQRVSEQRAYLEEKLSELTGFGAPKKRGRPAGSTSKKTGSRKKAA